MASQINCQSISKSYSRQLFRDVSLGVADGERIGLIGPNGAGKSTLLRILAGMEEADSGDITVRKGLRRVYLAQTEGFDDSRTIADILHDAIPESMDDALRYDAIENALTQLGLAGNHEQRFGELSGGQRKRVALATAFVQAPDVLLLDEPTNHLDLAGILWLEAILKGAPFSFVVISHDRVFLENVTNRMVEVNPMFPGGVFSTGGNYSQFLERKTAFLEGQSEQEATLANRLRRETEWLRRGPKARTTKARYRIDAAEKLRQEHSAVRGLNEQNKKVQIEFAATGRQTRRLIECKAISKRMADRTLFENLDLVLAPKSCLGLMGRNGAGKSTLIRLLTGEIQPDEGTIFRADGLRIVHFDQRRQTLNPDEPLRRALSPAGDTVIYQGRQIHVVGFAKRFLFRPEQLEMPVRSLSGGEQARILIARLMVQEADVLLLDEPTNDLDIASLEVLEESIEEFPGAVVLISHDRFFLNRLSDEILNLDGNGHATFYADYYQWLDAVQAEESAAARAPSAAAKPEKAAATSRPGKPRKLNNREQRELDQMEATILKAEEALHSCQSEMEQPEIATHPEKLAKACVRLEEAQKKVESLYERWKELESLRTESSV